MAHLVMKLLKVRRIKMGLCRTTICGLSIPFKKSENKKCINCEYVSKKWFRNKYECMIILGLNLDDGLYGCCSMYEKRS